MVTKVFSDLSGAELQCYLNKDNLCFIQAISDPTDIGDFGGHVVLDLEDVDALIKELRLIKSVMKIYQNEQK